MYLLCKKQDLAVLCICLFCRVLLCLPRSFGPLGGSHDKLGLASIKLRSNPAHDLESSLSNRSHGVPDLAGEGLLSHVANQSTRTWVQGLKGSRFPGPWFEVLRCLS
jgi:hypothetical protein